MNEKTESEIFEEQLNSLHKPIKQAPSTNESENKNNQNLANQNLSNNQGLERLERENLKEANEPSYLSTGIAYLDNKIKNRSITAFDYYMAKKFLGMDLNVNLNGNLDIKSENQTKIKNLTSATSKIYDGLKALNLGDRLIEKAQDNSGIFSALKRLANEKTSGLYGLNSDEAETVNALKNYSYSTARQMGGQLTNQKIKDAQEITKFGFRSKEENTARLGENQSRLIQILEQDMNNLESLGGKVPESVILELLKHKKRLEYIQKNQGRIKLKEYQQINPYSEHEQDDGK
ncbi:Coiled-coil domain-containing protein [Helicobacter pylori]